MGCAGGDTGSMHRSATTAWPGLILCLALAEVLRAVAAGSGAALHQSLVAAGLVARASSHAGNPGRRCQGLVGG